MAEMVKIATRESFGNAIAEFADQYPDVVVLDADSGGSYQNGHFQESPSRPLYRLRHCRVQHGRRCGGSGGMRQDSFRRILRHVLRGPWR